MHLATHRRVRQTMVTGPSSTYPFTTHPGVRFCFCFSFSPGSVRWQVASLHRLIFHPQILPRTLLFRRGRYAEAIPIFEPVIRWFERRRLTEPWLVEGSSLGDDYFQLAKSYYNVGR